MLLKRASKSLALTCGDLGDQGCVYCDQRRSLGGVTRLSVGARIAVGELAAGWTVQGRYVNSFHEGQRPELEQWSWRRRDGTKGQGLGLEGEK